MPLVVKGEVEVVCKHTFKIDLKELEENENYDTYDIKQLKKDLMRDIDLAGINQIKGYKFVKGDYDLDDLKIKVTGE